MSDTNWSPGDRLISRIKEIESLGRLDPELAAKINRQLDIVNVTRESTRQILEGEKSSGLKFFDSLTPEEQKVLEPFIQHPNVTISDIEAAEMIHPTHTPTEEDIHSLRKMAIGIDLKCVRVENGRLIRDSEFEMRNVLHKGKVVLGFEWKQPRGK